MNKVSIIVPVYKVEQYLRPCVDSILAQTYTNLQVILVDDGSPDNCGAICEEYAAADSRVLALHKENGGVSSARNYGLRYADGPYITFCDSDDAMTPDWIESLVTALEANQADVAIGGFTKVFADGTQTPENCHETGLCRMETPKETLAYCFHKVLSTRHGFEVWTRLFRSDIIRKNNIRFCETCGNYAEDLGFVLTYSLFIGRAVSIDHCGYLYSIRENSMIQSSVSTVKLWCLEEVYQSFEPYCRRAFPTDIAQRVLPRFYFQLLAGQVVPKVWSSGLEPQELRRAAMKSVRNWPATEERLRNHLEDGKAWNPWYSGAYNAEVISHMRFLLDGGWLRLRVECRLIRMFRPLLDTYGKLRREK